jgi:SepF-like predicted cell division protein (DUF552 family)
MAGFFSKVKDKFKNTFGADDDDELIRDADKEYVELDTSSKNDGSAKFVVRPYMLGDFSDIKEILEALREGNTICLVNIKPLKDKDMIELKRSINKLKKTADAIEGDIAGFGDDYIVVTPSVARIYRAKSALSAEEKGKPHTEILSDDEDIVQ